MGLFDAILFTWLVHTPCAALIMFILNKEVNYVTVLTVLLPIVNILFCFYMFIMGVKYIIEHRKEYMKDFQDIWKI